MVDDSIYSRLTGFSALTDIVGENIWAVAVPEDKTPKPTVQWRAVIFSRVSDDPTVAIDGTVPVDTARFQFSCMSNVSHREARSIAMQVREALQGYRGGEILASVFAGGGTDLYEPEDRMHHIPIDFHISY